MDFKQGQDSDLWLKEASLWPRGEGRQGHQLEPFAVIRATGDPGRGWLSMVFESQISTCISSFLQ